MKFIIDAQLPEQLALIFKKNGYNTIHTINLPEKNKTSDQEIIRITEKENRILITKDSDFYESKIITGKPTKVLFVLTGNIRNSDLIKLFMDNFDKIIELFNQFDLIELNRDAIRAK